MPGRRDLCAAPAALFLIAGAVVGAGVIALAGAALAADADDDINNSDPRWNMWVPELKEVTVLSDAWVFKNECHRKMIGLQVEREPRGGCAGLPSVAVLNMIAPNRLVITRGE
jgi:hypothetical protein